MSSYLEHVGYSWKMYLQSPARGVYSSVKVTVSKRPSDVRDSVVEFPPKVTSY